MSNFNEEKIVSALVDYLKPIANDLKTKYDWKPNLTRVKDVFNESFEIESDNHYENEIKLKSFVNKHIQNSNEILEIAKWIIKDWGGISTGIEEKTNDLIFSAVEDAKNSKTGFNFSRIASISKVLAFYNPQLYAIYDSRVAYSINWILLKKGIEKGNYFPVPDGRNSKMMAFDINVLIRLNFKKHYTVSDIKEIGKKYISEKDKNIYINNDSAYSHYIKIIKEVNKQIFPENSDFLYLTEMLLFSIADKDIYQDIVNSVSLKIN